MTAFLCGSCEWGTLFSQMVKLPILPVHFWGMSCMNCTFEISPNCLNDIEIRRLWWPHFLANDRSTWPCVLDHQLPGWWVQIFLQYFLITCWIHLAINFDQVPCATEAHTSPTQEWCLIDSSPNVAFMVSKKLHFGLITPNNFVPEVMSLFSLLFDVLWAGCFVALA